MPIIILHCHFLIIEFLAWRELFHYRANVLTVSKIALLLRRYYYDHSSVSKIVRSRPSIYDCCCNSLPVLPVLLLS